jgi:hypothetical protein
MAWAKREFATCSFGDRRLSSRLIKVATQLYSDTRVSIPKVTEKWGQAKALYSFMSNDHVSHDEILGGHTRATVERCRNREAILLVQDTTHCSFSGRQDREGLGPVDTKGQTDGFMCHTGLAVDAQTREPLGVLAQRVWARSKTPHPKNETKEARRKRARESDKWRQVALEAEQALRELGESRPLVIEVFDREGDHFDTIEALDAVGHDFVIRAARDRLLSTDDPENTYVSEAAATAPVVGSYKFTIPARPNRPARESTVTVRTTDVLIEPPSSRQRKGAALEVGLVYVCETEPPPGAQRVSWLLMTRQLHRTLAQAQRVVSHYLSRWVIEDFHMALKTGCALEERQLRSFHSLTNFLAVSVALAVEMIRLRHYTRTAPDLPASQVMSADRLATLRILSDRLSAHPTIREALHTIAGLGGFLRRKSDGEPGFRTLWLGLGELVAAERIRAAVLTDRSPG